MMHMTKMCALRDKCPVALGDYVLQTSLKDFIKTPNQANKQSHTSKNPQTTHRRIS